MQSSLEGRRMAWIFNSGAGMHSVLRSVAKCSMYMNDILLFIFNVLQFILISKDNFKI